MRAGFRICGGGGGGGGGESNIITVLHSKRVDFFLELHAD